MEEKEEVVAGTCRVGLDMQGLERGEAWVMIVGEAAVCCFLAALLA